jgi:pimeloyl-ACP methyl ester carboxylesterase
MCFRVCLVAVLIFISRTYGSSPQQQAPGLINGHWEGLMTREGKTWLVSFDLESQASRTVVLVDLIDYGIYALPFSIVADSSKVRLERKQPTGPSVLFEGIVEGETFTGNFSGLGVTAPFVLKRTKAPPSMLKEEEVTFRNGAVTLAGTVLIPNGPGPHPAVVCTHGSGPEGRQRAAYHSNGYFFARLGFVTLIYDKRGVGSSTGDFQTASLEDLADDALAGIHLLQTRKDVVGRSIGMTGVSQGGWISPLAATRSPDVAFILVISPSGINPMDQSVFSVENTLKKAGFPSEVVSTASVLRNRLYAMVSTGKFDDNFIADVEKVNKEPWFKLTGLPYPVPPSISDGERRFLLFEPIPIWEKVKVPVLALWGEEDLSVPATKSKDLIEQALARAKNRDFTFKIFPHADHTLSVVRPPTDAWDFPRTAPGSRQAMAEWLLRQASPRELKEKLVARSVTTHFVAPETELVSPSESTYPFEFHSGFWINLHHFLYEQALLRKRAANSGQTASIATTPKSQLSAEQQKLWDAALDYYTKTMIKRDLLLDSDMRTINDQLAESERASDLSKPGLSGDLIKILESVAPVYRALWWPQHDKANRFWIAVVIPMVQQFSHTLINQLTAAYKAKWPADLIRVDVVEYANWAGAYTTFDRADKVHITISTDPGNQGFAALEIVFHEASHSMVLRGTALWRKPSHASAVLRTNQYRKICGT